MNIVQKEFEIKCSQHPQQPIIFINTKQSLDVQDQQSAYLCELCLSENLTFSAAQIISIKQIIENGDKQIIQKWPPLNNQQILQDLILKIDQGGNKKPIESQIIIFFTELKEEILKQLDAYQKKIINYVSDHSQIIERYQKISKINELRDILIENKQNNLSKIEDLSKLLTDLHSKKEKNTQLLSDIMNRYSLLEDRFKQENLICFKNYVLSIFKKLDLFCIDDFQGFQQNQIPLNDNQKYIPQIMKLISNKTNYCSDEFLKTINEQLTKVEPFMAQQNFDQICEKYPIQFDDLGNEELDLINKQVDHMIKLKKKQRILQLNNKI
ncbi:hypothetical protein ABPG72_021270 [Tetrahymena utriculariae]